jgi:two-component system, OmpR family, phosphate regulon response regulator OmpR
VLVVEDDQEIANVLLRSLRLEGYDVRAAGDGVSALDESIVFDPDAVVLDLGLPRLDGVEVAKKLRSDGDVPILMLTARDEKESRIMGLEIGADDYLAKPFEPRELALRVANILKRARPPSAPPAESVRFGQFVFHIARGELRRGDEVIRLTDREREMLRILTASPGETVSRQTLAGSGGTVSERTVDVQVNRLRRKIERDSANPLIVQTVRGIGYRLVPAS